MKDINPHNARTVQLVPVTNLKPYSRNPRTHSKKQIRQIADSIQAFGWTNPILVDEDVGVIAGHGRLEAAKLLGQVEVPVLQLDHMTEEQKRAYVIADNRLAENAGWDEALLALELGALVDLEFDVTLTGFETAEIDTMLRVEGTDDADPRDDIAAPDKNKPAVTSPGDLWHLGPHRVLCADATDPDNWSLLMQEDRAEMVFTDPPYNVPIRGHVSGLGAVQHREFAMAAGEMTPEAFSSFLAKVCDNMAAVSREGAIHFICMDWAHL
ncbi:ParB/Srx family N-terminal domain-containing protein, partial [Roseobacter sp.]|uniref:ParB/Srx family N-terminal domain-containing protein n=1 Tax=Roseobacter sp. TaxID=1907202 RepID=UPI0025E43F99